MRREMAAPHRFARWRHGSEPGRLLLPHRAVKWSQWRVTLPHPPLYKNGEIPCPSTLAKLAEAGGHAPHSAMRNDLFSKQSRRACPVQLPDSGGSPRCRPVLWLAHPPASASPLRHLGGLRDRCIAAMLATQEAEVSGHAPQPLDRDPTGFQPAAARLSALTSKMVAPAGVAPAPDGL